MLSHKKGRQKYKTYDKLSYSPDDIAANLYKMTEHTFPEAEPINYKIFVPHPLNRNFTAKYHNFYAAHLQKRRDRLVFELKTVNLARGCAERLLYLQALYVEPKYYEKQQAAMQESVSVNTELLLKYRRTDLAGIELPFVGDGDVVYEILQYRNY